MAEFQFFVSGDVVEIKRFEINTTPKENIVSEISFDSDQTFSEDFSFSDRSDENRAYNLNANRNELQRMARQHFNEESFFVTFTFRDHYGMQEVSETDILFKNAIKRLRYKHKKISYLAVRELTKLGRVHYHMLLNDKYFSERWAVEDIQEKQKAMGFRHDRHKGKQVQIKCEERKKYENELAEIWSHGFCDMMQMGADNDNFGAYISKYMTKDLDLFKGHKSYLSSRNVKKVEPLKFKSVEDVPELLQDVISNFDMYMAEALKVAEKPKKEAFTKTYFNEYRGRIDFLELNLKRMNLKL